MRKLFILLAVVGLFATTSKAQLIDEKNVTVTMELQPILQLNMTTPDHVEFIFDDIREYYSGIVKYGATVLKVSSSVNWDLYAVGTSLDGATWDQQISYATINANSSIAIPIGALELHQYEPNECTSQTGNPDYSGAFTVANTPVIGQNSIFASATPYDPPTIADKYIQGGANILAAAGEGALSGSYLTAGATVPTDYYYVIDYRILPGLPATFPASGTNVLGGGVADGFTNPVYANPGVYTMNCKYVLLEDQ